MMELNYAGWKLESCDDGPGIRTVLFLQGCSKNCPGCHNAKTHDAKSGYKDTIAELVIHAQKICCNKRITISGGEPLEQLTGLYSLIGELKSLGFEVCVYTSRNIGQVPAKLLHMIDYIKVGPFIEQLRDAKLQYVGSSNQRFFHCVKGQLREISLAKTSLTPFVA